MLFLIWILIIKLKIADFYNIIYFLSSLFSKVIFTITNINLKGNNIINFLITKENHLFCIFKLF